MKKLTNIILSLILVLLLPACESELLDKTPLDSYSDATVWSDPALASAYLSYCYQYLNYGLRAVMLGSVCDEMPVGRGSSNQPYNAGTISPDNLGGAQGNPFFTHLSWSSGNWQNVQRLNLFLDNIDLIKDKYPASEQAAVKAKTDVLKGEALFLRAFVYHNFCRLYGGLPLMNTANKLGDDFGGITRSTFEATVNFIMKDCDDAAALLPLKANQTMGRATKEAALTLKSRILLFAASDLTADGTAKSELVGYKSGTNRTTLWTNAKNAAKAVMDLGTAKLADFGAPDKAAVAKNYFEMFKAYTLANDEVIWGRMFSLNLGGTHRINQTNGPNGINNFGRNGPLQQMVDEYEMEDGSKFFDHFEINASKLYKNKSAKYGHESPYYDREPRFYANVLYDSAVWQARPANLAAQDPLGIYERRTHRKMTGATTYTDQFGLDTRKGPLSPGNGCYGGYLTKKFMDNTSNGDVTNNQNIWIFMRYAEVVLNYAEACMELGETVEAAKYINQIRTRSALPDFTGDIERALRHERKIELYCEESRWYDIRRWKILIEAMTPPLGGIDILEVKNLDGTYTTTWKWISAHAANAPSEKLYWIPIGTTELKKAPQLEQNPGY
ncbi:MAG: RagB/SusD family nutrient uptake outer membrane protein [Bacteroidales bacterium]|nr:RagB/SusD family nutrient uptake outer membrane protein [Bacteroidales bacterium]MDP3003798.1 RagB/SusD family nutrient uptake outer membrane protein [Bacteroidales bacterium]